MKIKTKILIAFFAVASASLYAQTNVTASYGSAFSGADGSTFANASGSVFSASNTGVLAFGWSDGFDDLSSISSMLEDFNVLGSLNFDSASSGFNPGSVSFDNDVEAAAGKTGYWLVLAGVSDFTSGSVANEIGIFNDEDWAVAPVGSLTGDSWDTAQIGNVDNVVFGSQVASGGFGAGTPQFRTLPVPEPFYIRSTWRPPCPYLRNATTSRLK